MNIIPKSVALMLSVMSIILSMKFLYNSFDYWNGINDGFYNATVMVFSNIVLALVFIAIYLDKDSTNTNEMIKSNLIRIIIIFLFVYLIICFCIFMNNLFEFGFSSGENLTYQISVILFFLLSVGYTIYILKEKNEYCNK